MAEQAPSAEVVPEHQDRGLLGLFGNKKEEEGRHDGATHTQAQAQAAHPYPTNPPHVTAVDQQYGQGYAPPVTAVDQQYGQGYAPPVTAVDQQYGQGYAHGHEGQFTTGEAEKQQHTGLLGKLHRTNSSSSSSSSDEEGGKKNEGGRKKKGIKEKIKEKLPGGQKQSDEYGREGEKEGLVDKIKDKLPGHHNKDQ